MSDRVSVSIVGASGYTGGELLRLLHTHPRVEIRQATSERLFGKRVSRAHPNLRKRTELSFSRLDDLSQCDVLFTCLPHGETMGRMAGFMDRAERLIDLSADFRLNDEATYQRWYGRKHEYPELMKKFVYGIPELHREEMREAKYVSSAGCNATVTLLALHPLYREGLVDTERTVVEVKVGSSEAGNKSNESSHHPERSGSVRSFKPSGHRHTAEIEQELGLAPPARVHFSVTAIEMVRGALATCHVFLKKDLAEKDIWRVYRKWYGDEPFIRIVKERDGIYRLPEPKLLAGTNYCDVGFAREEGTKRLVVISAIDNLGKGAAGQAVQAFNIMHDFEETAGLEFSGLHP
jgi:N-acetyl-gamma-glutamyl-phosphate/LysW-gamma-L-alpha-aminoadipyl-6-phosphate reductase